MCNAYIQQCMNSFLQTDKKKRGNSIEKRVKDLNRHFTKEHTQMVNIMEGQIQTTVQYYFIPTRMSTMKKEEDNAKYWQGHGATRTFLLC